MTAFALMSRRTREGTSVDPLALDPYSPIVPARGPERAEWDRFALGPYSPIFPTRASARSKNTDQPTEER